MARMTINEAVQVAGCSSPEGKDTDGAKWLREVIEAGEEMMDDFNIVDDSYAKDAGSVIFEWADGQVPIYTNQLWNVWVDLGGYYFDGEYRDFSANSDTGDTMNRVAQADCYEWAERILSNMARDAGVEM